PEVQFHIAGEGEMRPALERAAAEAGIADRFFLPGAVHDIPAFLARLDIAVLPSRSEGMSNALLEYMAASLPIVATPVGANPRLTDDAVHGLLVPPGEPAALANAIDRLLGEPAWAAQLGAAARRRVEESHSRQVMVRRFEAFYEELVQRIVPRRNGCSGS